MATNRRFAEGWHTYTIWSPISTGPSMRDSVVWKWRAAESPLQIGSSICKSSPPEAFDERGHTLPLNPVECGKDYYSPVGFDVVTARNLTRRSSMGVLTRRNVLLGTTVGLVFAAVGTTAVAPAGDIPKVVAQVRAINYSL